MKVLVSIFIVSMILIAGCTQEQPIEKKAPNILFVLVDDLGWGDLGLNFQNEKTGKRHFTPKLDKMAQEGVRMTSHYCPAPICAPSRASLLLGQHQGHASVRDKQFDKALTDQLTLGSVMQMAGYKTVLVGKYGLQGEGKDPESWPAYPTKRGFTEFFGYPGHLAGHIHYPYHNWPIGDKEKHQTPKELWHQQEEISGQLEKCYTTDLFTAYAKKWIVEHNESSPEKPFMMLLAYDTPHAALQVASAPYPEGKGLSGGIQWVGESGKMINTATGEIDSYIHPDYRKNEWSEVERRFASMVRRIDNAIADILQLLRDLKIDQNTMVVFTSDNGPHRESYIAGQNYAPTSFQSYGPFEGIKSDVWEGGIRMPTQVWWPGKIPAGLVDTNISQFHDWLSTFTELAGFQRPAISDGINLMPQLTGQTALETSTVYVEFTAGSKTPDYEDFETRKRGNTHNQMQVIFLDGYKGLRTGIKSHDQDFEIYDVTKDPKERNNLAGTTPTFVELNERMKARVLQLHIANESAPRPYDYANIPAVTVTEKLSSGLHWKAQKGESPWVAQLTNGSIPLVVDSHEIPRFRPDHLYQAEGFIKIPEEGNVILQLKTQGQVVIKVHDNVVLQKYDPDNASTFDSNEIFLAEGFHPIRVYAKDMKEDSKFVLFWTINGKRSVLSEGTLVSSN